MNGLHMAIIGLLVRAAILLSLVVRHMLMSVTLVMKFGSGGDVASAISNRKLSLPVHQQILIRYGAAPGMSPEHKSSPIWIGGEKFTIGVTTSASISGQPALVVAETLPDQLFRR
jgi:hypothetical protein